MTTFLSRWSWLDDGVLPGLITIVRACWIWPWLGLVQLGLAPNAPASVLALWLVLLLPLLSFSLARWASHQTTSVLSSAPSPPSTLGENRKPEIPLLPRLFVGLSGILVALLVTWWQLYSNEFAILNPAWFHQMLDSLIHWPDAFVPPAVLLIVTGLLLWLRGLVDASNALTHDTIWSIFLLGITMMVFYLITISLSDLDRASQLLTAVLVMLAAGMGALAFSSVKITAGLDRALGFGVRQLNESATTGGSTTGGSTTGDSASTESGTLMASIQTASMPIVNRYWLLSVGGSIAILMLLGILLALLIAPKVLEALLNRLWAVVTFIGDMIASLLLLLAYIAAVIFFYFYQFIEPLLKRLMENFNLDPQLFENLQPQPEATQEATELVERAPVPDEYRWLGLLIFAMLTILTFALVIRRLSKTESEMLDEERESILSADLLQDQLNSLWDRLRGRFRKQDADDPFLPLDGEETRRRIRSVYQTLLATATELGQSRNAALTPVEYENRLVHTPISEASEPDAITQIRQFYGQRFAPQLEVITAGYVAARYGDKAPNNEIADNVEKAWKEIERGITPED